MRMFALGVISTLAIVGGVVACGSDSDSAGGADYQSCLDKGGTYTSNGDYGNFTCAVPIKSCPTASPTPTF